GTTSLFGVIGQLRQGPTVVGGQLVPRWRAGLRLPYDKRIEEGLSARHPLEGLQRLVQDPAALGA
ncbi:MAG: hypothetical protein RMK29_21615, partial [Myxococcales bacterium]|nr:hypothetical protein [Myxococcales bacterium]